MEIEQLNFEVDYEKDGVYVLYMNRETIVLRSIKDEPIACFIDRAYTYVFEELNSPYGPQVSVKKVIFSVSSLVHIVETLDYPRHLPLFQ